MYFILKIVSIYFLTCFSFTKGVSEDIAYSCPNSDISTTAPVQLKNNLLCQYENKFRPVKNHNTTVVANLRVVLKYLSYDFMLNTLSLNAWYHVVWKDEHLRWNPSDYDNIDSFNIDCSEIWTPDVSILNLIDESENPYIIIGDTPCYVDVNGTVATVSPYQTKVLCIADLTYYPFDTQTCSIYFGSWAHKGEALNFQISNPFFQLSFFEKNDEWEVISARGVKNDGKISTSSNTFPTIQAEIVFKRLHAAHTASFIIPMLVLILITLLSLWLEVMSSERLYLCFLNLIIHFLHLQYISWGLPLKGNKIPLIILFGRDSMLMSSFTILLTIVLRNLLEKKAPTPGWISTLVNFFSSCRLGQMFLNKSISGATKFQNEDDGTTIINNSENRNDVIAEDWKIFAELVDKLCFIIYCLVYFIMMLGFVP